VLAISDSSLWQELVLKGLEIPHIVLPQRGTVTAAALDLAFCLTSGKIFLTGADLSIKDIRSHAKPYSFDILWEGKSCRTNPFYSQIFSRSAETKAGGSHSIYASWFKNQLEAYPKRLYSLGANNSVFKNYTISSLDGIRETKGKNQQDRPLLFKTKALNFSEKPAKLGTGILKSALINPAYSARLIEELCPLLFPKEPPASLDELGETLTAVLKPYWGQEHG
jgi:hypothetical protein